MLPQKQQKNNKKGTYVLPPKKTFFSQILYFENKIEDIFLQADNRESIIQKPDNVIFQFQNHHSIRSQFG